MVKRGLISLLPACAWALLTMLCPAGGAAEVGLRQDSHCIDINGVSESQVAGVTITTDLYTMNNPHFDTLGTSNGVESAGYIVDGPAPSDVKVAMTYAGRHVEGGFKVPAKAKNKRAIYRIVFELKGQQLLGHVEYADLKDMTNAFDWMGTRIWSFGDDGSITGVEARRQDADGRKVANIYTVVASEPVLSLVSVVSGNDSELVYFHFDKHGIFESSELQTGEDPKDMIRYTFNSAGKPVSMMSYNEITKDIDKPMPIPAVLAIHPRSHHDYLVAVAPWKQELQRAGLDF